MVQLLLVQQHDDDQVDMRSIYMCVVHIIRHVYCRGQFKFGDVLTIHQTAQLKSSPNFSHYTVLSYMPVVIIIISYLLWQYLVQKARDVGG